MQDLTFVDVDPDGAHLVLEDSDGGRFRLTIDDELRAAVRGDLDRLRDLKAASSGPLRPKDIQARIRGGMSAEDLAAATGTPIAQIKPYELPVLAEREHAATLARRTALKRTASADVLLEDAVTERLVAREAEPGRLWDAWREESGTWVVELTFTAAGKVRRARWRFDQHAATLDPIDDEARWLSDAPPAKPRDPNAPKERVYDVEADGGVIESEQGPDDAPEQRPSASPTLDLLEALRGRRGVRQPVGADPSEEHPDLVDALLEGDPAPAAHPPASRPDLATDAEVLALPKNPEPEPEEATPEPEPEPEEPRRTARQHPQPGSTQEADKLKPAKGRKSSIPSWDDIVFGAKRD